MNNDELINSWILYNSARKNSIDRDKHYWAEERLNDLVMNEPQQALTIILELMESDLNEHAFSCLAAGPLEDLLADWGDEIIDQVEELARKNPKFNQLLRGVWQNAMSDEVWARIKKVSNNVW